MKPLNLKKPSRFGQETTLLSLLATGLICLSLNFTRPLQAQEPALPPANPSPQQPSGPAGGIVLSPPHPIQLMPFASRQVFEGWLQQHQLQASYRPPTKTPLSWYRFQLQGWESTVYLQGDQITQYLFKSPELPTQQAVAETLRMMLERYGNPVQERLGHHNELFRETIWEWPVLEGYQRQVTLHSYQQPEHWELWLEISPSLSP